MGSNIHNRHQVTSLPHWNTINFISIFLMTTLYNDVYKMVGGANSPHFKSIISSIYMRKATT